MYLLRRGGTLVNRNLAKTSHRRRYTISRDEIQNIYTSGKKVEFKIRNMLGSLLQDQPLLQDIPPENKAYATSRYVSFEDMEAFGFDFDYTIAQWGEEMQPLIYDMIIERLILLGYPSDLKHFKFDPEFPVRGLFFDIKRGNLMKIDYLNTLYPGYVYFGRKALTKTQIYDQYGGPHVSKNSLDNMRALVDRFCMAEACVIADIIEYSTRMGINFDPSYIYNDVSKVLNTIHSTYLLHDEVMKDISKYLKKSDDLSVFFNTLKENGKSTFLLTNSPHYFVKQGMEYLLGKDWNDLFDIVILEADKPRFFLSDRRPFRERENERVSWEKISRFSKGKAYVEGNFHDFHKISKFRGNKTVYFGDHIFSDVKEPSRISGWRTVAILQELEEEMIIQGKKEYRDSIALLYRLERLLYRIEFSNHNPSEEVALRIKELTHEITKLRKVTKVMFSPYFGSVFRTHTNATNFAFSLQRYTDIYTSKLENFNNYPMNFVHYAERQFLPHESELRKKFMLDVRDDQQYDRIA